MENKKEEGKTENQAKVIALAVVVFIILAGFLIILLRNGDQEETAESDPATTASQDGAGETGVTSESPGATPPGTEQSPLSDPDPTTNDENADDDTSSQTSPPAANLDKRLPENWNQLSSREKTAVNPHGCYEGSVIRSDNGRCVIPGTSINYIFLTTEGPHSYLPGLVGFQPVYRYVGVPDNTSDADMDKLFELFKSTQVYPEYSGSESAGIQPDEYLGVPADVLLHQLEVYYYSDFRFDDDAWHGVEIDYENSRRSYLIHPRHYFRATVFGGYGVSNESDKASRVHEEGRNGSLQAGCGSAVDVVLFYRSEELDWAEEGAEEKTDVIYYYGHSSPTAADFRAAIVDTQGKLQPKFRREMLMSVGLANITAGEEVNKQYDILLKFYRYDGDKGDDLSLYDASDVFMPDIHVVECS